MGSVTVLSHGPDPAFDESAVKAVRQWRYRPAMKEGRPVAVYFTVVVEFRLQSDEEEARAPLAG